MSKTELVAASAAALILACVAGWTISDTQARAITPTATAQINPFKMMTNAEPLSAKHFADYSLVFN